jgi:hypothetical protein
MATKRTKRSKRHVTANKQARLVSRLDRNGRVRSETTRRDPNAFNAAIRTDQGVNSTTLFLDNVDGLYSELRLNGHQARTLFNLLRKHYSFTGKDF